MSFLASNAGLQTSLIDLVSKIHNGTETRNDYINVLKDIGVLGVGVVGLTNLAGITSVGLIPLIAVGVSLAVWDYVDGHPELVQEMKDIFNNPANLKEWVDIWDFFNDEYNIQDNVNNLYTSAKNWSPPRADPLVLDLDGDGIETIGIGSAANVLFDYDGDGVKTATGWVKADDGMLVLDRNGNGTIDNGGELFGDQTLVQGVKAANGFAALSAEDTNKNGKFDAGDANFTKVRIWQDKNSDGVSQTDELRTLSELGTPQRGLFCYAIHLLTSTASNNQNFKNKRRVA